LAIPKCPLINYVGLVEHSEMEAFDAGPPVGTTFQGISPSISAHIRRRRIAMQVREVGSGAAQRQAREKLLEAAHRREMDVVLAWRLGKAPGSCFRNRFPEA
jgi:adenylosuccinate synthase